MSALRSILTAVVAWAIVAPAGMAQQGSQQTRVADAAASCAPAADAGNTIAITVPNDVLDYLQARSSSVVIQAFLIGLVAEKGDANHWMTKCARAFIDAPAYDQSVLETTYMPPMALLREMRRANDVRASEDALRGEANPTLIKLLSRLAGDSAIVYITSAQPTMQALRDARCRVGGGRICGALDSVLAAMRDAQNSDIHVTNLQAMLDKVAAQTRTQSATPTLQLPAPATADSIARASIVADSATQASQKWRDSLEKSRTAFADTLARTEEARHAALRQLQAIIADIATTSDAKTKDAPLTVTALPTIAQVVRILGVPAQEPLAPLPRTVEPSHASSVAVELTNFVVERSKQELAVSLIGTAYNWLRADSLLRSSFPQTYSLMRQLARGDKLRASDAGRVALTTWRAALAMDAQRMPLAVLSSEESVLCAADTGCLAVMHRIRPAAIIGRRLLAGDALLDVLREAPDSIAIAIVKPTLTQRRLLQGLAVVSALTEAYELQGGALAVDPTRQPFILSPATLQNASDAQRKALVRLLALRAVSYGPAFGGLAADGKPLFDAVASVSRALDALLVRSAAAEKAAPSLGFEVRQAGRVLTIASGAGGVAAALDPSLSDSLAVIRNGWLVVGEVLPQLLSRSYTPAIIETLGLLERSREQRLPRSTMTIALLAASLADARDGEEMKLAFENAAAPIGGWESKRYRESSRVSITAFPGIWAGQEWAIDAMSARAGGVALPIGLDVQLLSRRADREAEPSCPLWLACSVGLFLPLLDPGVLESFRFQSTGDVDTNPNQSIKQIFSPGFYFSMGIRHTILTMLVGGQFVPDERHALEGQPSVPGHTFRAGVSFGADVTLISF